MNTLPVNLILKSTKDCTENSVLLSNVQVCEVVQQLVSRQHPRVLDTVRIELHANTAHILLVMKYLQNQLDWLPLIDEPTAFAVLTIATVLKIPSLCRLLYRESTTDLVEPATLETFFKQVTLK